MPLAAESLLLAGFREKHYSCVLSLSRLAKAYGDSAAMMVAVVVMMPATRGSRGSRYRRYQRHNDNQQEDASHYFTSFPYFAHLSLEYWGRDVSIPRAS